MVSRQFWWTRWRTDRAGLLRLSPAERSWIFDLRGRVCLPAAHYSVLLFALTIQPLDGYRSPSKGLEIRPRSTVAGSRQSPLVAMNGYDYTTFVSVRLPRWNTSMLVHLVYVSDVSSTTVEVMGPKHESRCTAEFRHSESLI